MKTDDLTPQEAQAALTPLFDKYPFVRALYQDVSGLIITANLKQTIAEPTPHERGIVVTIFKDGVLFEASASLSSLKDLKKLVRGLEDHLSEYKTPQDQFRLSPEETLEKDFIGEMGEEIPLKTKISSAQGVVQKIKNSDPLVVMAQVRYKHTLSQEFYISKKRILSQKLSRFEAIFIALLKNPKGESAQIYDGYGYQGGWEKMVPSDNLIHKMIADGKKILGAPRLTPGFYDCIFSPEMAGILAHEAFGHGTEADTMLKGRAKGSDYLNQRVASPMVSLYDSPVLEGHAGSYFFDHEGELASTTKIVENGILKNPMTDHYSASRLGVRRSPNGRRQSYDHKVYTRMTNTYFMPGKSKPRDMFSSVENGFFVDRVTNGMEDPKGWGIQLEALYAEEIKKGRLTGKVYSPVIVTGYVPDILNSVTMVSDELEINGLGMCGKGHKEWIKVTDGGPYLKLKARLA